MHEFPHVERIIGEAQRYAPLQTAVVLPVDRVALGGAVEAHRSGLLAPLLVGPRELIEASAHAAGLDISAFSVVECSAPLAASTAARLCLEGRVEALMKGALHTDDMMRAVLTSNLRTARRASHVLLVDIPGFDRPLIITDAAINIAPGVEEKLHIIQNAVDLAQAIGIGVPRVAVLSAVETVNPKVRSTVEAAALRAIALHGGVSGAIVDGPLSLDLALSAEAARIKRVDSPVAGHADILVAPDLEAGNFLYKAVVYLAKAETAGIVLGARAPVILTSRASSVQSRIASCALGLLYARRVTAARLANEPAVHVDQLARPRG